MVKVADIANKTGLGYSTVAQIISGKRNYRPETVEKVMTAATAMGYVPNYLSKALAGDKSMSIGIYMSSLDNPVEVEVLHPIELAARQNNYSTFVCSSNSNDERAITLIKSLFNRKVDGIIFYNTVPRIPEIRELLLNSSIPIVYIDLPPEKDISALIEINNTVSLRGMARCLSECGHREACFLSNPYKMFFPEKLIEPMRNALNNVNIELKVEEKWKCGSGGQYEQLAYEVTSNNVKHGDIPKLIIAHNDYAAIGAIAAFTDNGIKVPEDVSVIGFEGSRISPFLRPRLSTINMPSGKVIGKKAFEMLLMMMKSPKYLPSKTVLESKFIQGETIAKIN